MTHDEVVELLGAYALHAVDADERAAVEEHLATCPRCRAELREHEEVAAALGNSGGAAPDGLWDRIASTLDEAPPPLRLVGAGPRRSSRGVAAVVALAAAVLIGALGLQVARQDHRIDHLQSALAREGPTRALELALLAPGAHRTLLTSTDGRLSLPAVVLPDGTGYLLTDTVPALSDGQTYQLWGATDAGLLSLGVLGAKPEEVVTFAAGKGVRALAITEERAPGVSHSTHAPLVAGELS